MRIPALCATAATIIVCGCEVQSPTTTDAAKSIADGAVANYGVIVSTTGGGQFDLSAVGLGIAEFSFAALQQPNGAASGHFRQVRLGSSGIVDFSGDIVCVTHDAVNHRAWIGAIVTHNNSTDPAFLTDIHEPGDDVWFRVVDYGEGGDAPADRTTVLGFKGAGGIDTSPQYCAAQIWPADDARTWPVVNGNIQVH